MAQEGAGFILVRYERQNYDGTELKNLTPKSLF